ncbi:MAG: GIY-YIG nuclease family protein [Spirulinaceae cyanobacterium]
MLLRIYWDIRDRTQMTWKDWQWVKFGERQKLPHHSGIYIVADREDFIWYVGQATDLQQRWIGKNHHRYRQLIRSNRKRDYKIYWQPVPTSKLDAQEKYYINLFKPELNGNKVKTYLPKTPQVEREIKRLLKALNRQTLIWPKIRFILAGEYQESNAKLCFVFIINLNDRVGVLANSRRKRYSSQIRQAWGEIYSLCDRDKEQYNACEVIVYTWENYQFEFVEFSDLIRYLDEHPDACDRHLGLCEILGVTVKALKTTEILDTILPEEEYKYIRSDNKITLKNGAYLKSRQPILKTSVNRVYE